MSGYQTQPAVFPGFAMLEVRCGRCGYEWIGVAAVGTVGLECPKCRFHDADFAWLGPKPWSPHDGTWLTGGYLLPWWTGQPTAAQAATTNEQEEEIDAYTGEPRSFVKRWLSRLQNAWWALKGEW